MSEHHEPLPKISRYPSSLGTTSNPTPAIAQVAPQAAVQAAAQVAGHSCKDNMVAESPPLYYDKRYLYHHSAPAPMYAASDTHWGFWAFTLIMFLILFLTFVLVALWLIKSSR